MSAPVLTSAVSFTLNRVRVFFSEAMDGLGVAANFTIAGLVVTVATASADTTYTDLTTTGMVAGTTYTVVAGGAVVAHSGALGLASNSIVFTGGIPTGSVVMEPLNTAVHEFALVTRAARFIAGTALKDNPPPAEQSANLLEIVSVTCSASNTIAIVFNKNVLLGGLARNPANWATAPLDSSAPVSITGVSVDHATLTLTTTEHTTGGNYQLTMAADMVSDKGDPLTASLLQPYTGAGVAPSLVMARAVDERIIELVFSEFMDDTTAIVPSNYSITGPTAVSVLSVEKVTDLTYRLHTTAQTSGATYTVTVSSNVRDLAKNPVS